MNHNEFDQELGLKRRTVLRGIAIAGAIGAFGLSTTSGVAGAVQTSTATLYGVEKNTGNFFQIDASAASPTAVQLTDLGGNPISIPAALLDGDTTNLEVELNANSPNGNALDTTNDRYFFTEFKDDAATNPTSDLWFIDLTDGSFTKSGALEGRSASGTYYDGAFWYVKNVDDAVQRVDLNPDGTVASETTKGRLFNDILNRADNAPDGQFGLFFGDIEFDDDGLMYFSCDTKRPVQRLQGTWDPDAYDATDYTAATTLWGVLGTDSDSNGIPDPDPASSWETVVGDKLQVAFAGPSYDTLYGHRTADGQIFEIDVSNPADPDPTVTAAFQATDGFTDITGNKDLGVCIDCEESGLLDKYEFSCIEEVDEECVDYDFVLDGTDGNNIGYTPGSFESKEGEDFEPTSATFTTDFCSVYAVVKAGQQFSVQELVAEGGRVTAEWVDPYAISFVAFFCTEAEADEFAANFPSAGAGNAGGQGRGRGGD